MKLQVVGDVKCIEAMHLRVRGYDVQLVYTPDCDGWHWWSEANDTKGWRVSINDALRDVIWFTEDWVDRTDTKQ